jgi:hypothetical protein
MFPDSDDQNRAPSRQLLPVAYFAGILQSNFKPKVIPAHFVRHFGIKDLEIPFGPRGVPRAGGIS